MEEAGTEGGGLRKGKRMMMLLLLLRCKPKRRAGSAGVAAHR